jgi:hypothetical protein
MATSTTKLGLTKPDFVDVVDITDLNSNADDIDAAVGFTICTNATRPGSPWTGQSIFETDTGSSFIWDGSAWQPGGGGGSIEISATAPASPAAGDLWWDSDNGNLYIYYDDGTSQQWVAANGPQVFVGAAAPAGYQGQMWFDSTTGKMYVYYDDGTSSQWVSAIGGSLAGSVLQVVSTAKTNVFTTTSFTFADVTGLSANITPSATSSKILVTAQIAVGGKNSAYPGQFKITRDGTDVYIGDAASTRTRAVFGGIINTNMSNFLYSFPITFLDSPSSTSSLDYQVETRTDSGTVYVNRTEGDSDGLAYTRGASSITLMEVAG